MLKITRKLLCAGLMGAMASLTLTSVAQADWPERPVSMIIMSKQGGGMDRASRLLGESLSKRLGQPIKYVNRPGASGEIALKMFLETKDDGYTLFSGNIATLMMMYALRGLDFEFSEKVTWLGGYLDDPALLVTPSASPFGSLEEFVASAKTNPVRVGVANWASVQTLALLQFRDATGVKMEIIPYSGFKGAATALLGNHIEAAVGNFSATEKLGDGVRYLGIFADQSPDKNVEVRSIGKTLGIDVIRAASVRALAVHASLKSSHPDRYEKLRMAFAETITDPSFIDGFGKIGAAESQAINMDEKGAHLASQGIVKQLEEYKSVFEKQGS